MANLPQVPPARLARALQRAGFTIVRQRGSHAIFEHADGRFAVVPMHGGSVSIGTLNRILNTAGITPDELRGLL